MYISAGTIIFNTRAQQTSILCVHQKYSYTLADVFYYGQHRDYERTMRAMMQLSEDEWRALKAPGGVKDVFVSNENFRLSRESRRFIRSCIRDYAKIYPCTRRKGGGVWSVPKGRVQILEHEIDAAIRETCEETNLDPGDFSLIHTRPIIINYVGSNGKRYKLILYLARAEKTTGVTGELSNTEVDLSAWIELNELEKKVPEYGRRLLASLKKRLHSLDLQID